MSARTVDYIDGDTITAIATPIGSGGIGIIRISGDRSIDIAKSLFTKGKIPHPESDRRFLDQLPSHRLSHGYIYDMQNQELVDEVLLVIMRAPHSYTCEDVVEIQSHCGPVILDKILRLILAGDARMAMPGEFTRRAFLNGRIDLIQAEAVGEMISAKSESALKMAITHLTGRLQEAVSAAIQSITDLQVELEADLEFGEEIPDSGIDHEGIKVFLENRICKPIRSLLDHYDEGCLLRDGLRLGIAGRPNVGKSSLLNCLLRRDRAIVTPLPGTTRDLIEESINISGLPLIITDTAGLHNTRDPVETIGIQKTRENINQSDLVLFIVDGQDPFNEADELAYDQVGAKRIIVVINKIDLISDPQSVPIPSRYAHHEVVWISAKFAQGLDQLMERIQKSALGDITIEPGRCLVPNLRQKVCLESALNALLRAKEAVEMRVGEELIVIDLENAKDALNEVIGQQFNNDILDQLFNTFCIGK